MPLARFGHTIALVSKRKVVLFGGATGDTGKYVITSDTYTLDLNSNKWKKIEGGGIVPSPRAAHASTSIDALQMIVYGGATGGGSLASDDLFLLDLRKGDEIAQWMVVPVVGQTPGRRYGHSIAFSKPNVLVFGGNTGSEAVNDVWCLNVEVAPFSWSKLESQGKVPMTRVYHSAALCTVGAAQGMMVIFGGRTQDGSSLKDAWGFRRHKNGKWDWVEAPYKSSQVEPLARYQHSSTFVGSLMLILGGRTNTVGENLPLEIYDTESSEWHRLENCP